MFKLIVNLNKCYDKIEDVKRTLLFLFVILPIINISYIIDIIFPNLLSNLTTQLIWSCMILLFTSIRIVALFNSFKENTKNG